MQAAFLRFAANRTCQTAQPPWKKIIASLKVATGERAEHFCGGGTQRRAAANHRDGELLTKVDFVDFMGRLVEKVYAGAKKIHLLLDNLNTHFRHSFVEAPGASSGSRSLLARVEFYDTPKHAGWLNMAEIEIGIMDRQCTGRRLGSEAILQSEAPRMGTSALLKPKTESNGNSPVRMPTKTIPTLCSVIIAS